MRARHWSGALFAAVLILCSASPQAQEPAGGKPARLLLEIDTPEPGAVVGDPGGNAFVAGRALALFGEFQTFDIMFVIDTSDSTAAPSGADVDGDGKVGSRRGGEWFSIFGRTLALGNTDRGDSILAAEVAAVETMVNQLDPRTTRVGVVTFSGDFDPGYPDAFTRVPLTSDFDKVGRGLQEVLDDGPNGMTNMRSGVHVGRAKPSAGLLEALNEFGDFVFAKISNRHLDVGSMGVVSEPLTQELLVVVVASHEHHKVVPRIARYPRQIKPRIVSVFGRRQKIDHGQIKRASERH